MTIKTNATIKAWDYLVEYEQEQKDILDAVDKVFRSGRLVLGESVESFEQEFAALHNVGSCVGMDNGTNSLSAALQALGVKPGDEVITVSNTAAATAVAIDAIGAIPVFVDIDPETYLMDTDKLPQVLTRRTKAIVPVHLFGQCVDMGAIAEFAKSNELLVVEDCAQAHGARREGQMAGTFGDAAAFSFYPTKILGGYGDGGAVITDNSSLDHALRQMRFYGFDEKKRVVSTPAGNSRLDEVHAEILRRKLTRLDDYVKRRQTIAARYDKALADLDGLVLPVTATGNSHAYYLYVVRHPNRDQILSELESEGIYLDVSYREPIHLMPAFAGRAAPESPLVQTERLAKQIFSLPTYPSLPDEHQERLIQALKIQVGSKNAPKN